MAHRVSWEAAIRLLNSMYVMERQGWRIAVPPSNLGAFANLRKATVSFVVSVRLLSVRKEQLGFYWTDFH